MSLVQMVKSGGVSTFGELATMHGIITAPLGKDGCKHVDVVFDSYITRSIKAE